MDNPEMAARAAQAYKRAHSILSDSLGSVDAMKTALRRAAEIIRDELGDRTAADSLTNLTFLDDFQVSDLHRKWLDDTRKAAELFADLAPQLSSLRKKWWQFWK